MRNWLLSARTEAGLTSKQMGEALNITESYYSMIECGTRQKRMDITLVAKLSDVLAIPLAVIVEYESEGGKAAFAETNERGE